MSIRAVMIDLPELKRLGTQYCLNICLLSLRAFCNLNLDKVIWVDFMAYNYLITNIIFSLINL